jgi:hypothetical protein
LAELDDQFSAASDRFLDERASRPWMQDERLKSLLDRLDGASRDFAVFLGEEVVVAAQIA